MFIGYFIKTIDLCISHSNCLIPWQFLLSSLGCQTSCYVDVLLPLIEVLKIIIISTCVSFVGKHTDFITYYGTFSGKAGQDTQLAMATEQSMTEQPHCSSSDNSHLSPDSKPLTTSTGEEATPGQDRSTGKPLRAEKKTSVQIVEPEYKGYTVIKVEEKHGPLHNAIPCMPLPIAIICCILNIITPGIGEFFS